MICAHKFRSSAPRNASCYRRNPPGTNQLRMKPLLTSRRAIARSPTRTAMLPPLPRALPLPHAAADFANLLLHVWQAADANSASSSAFVLFELICCEGGAVPPSPAGLPAAARRPVEGRSPTACNRVGRKRRMSPPFAGALRPVSRDHLSLFDCSGRPARAPWTVNIVGAGPPARRGRHSSPRRWSCPFRLIDHFVNQRR
jgi:hypothetical protein